MDSENTDDIIELHASPNRKNEEEESIEKLEESVYADAHDETFKDSTQNEIINEEQLLNSPKKTDEDELMEDSESTNQNANNSIDNIDDRIEDDEIMSSQEVNCEVPPLVEPQPAATNDNHVATDVDMENELDYTEDTATVEEIETITSSPVKSSNQTSSSEKLSNIAPSESSFEPHSEFESTIADFERYNVSRSERTTASSTVEIESQSDLTSCVSERTIINPSESEVIESSDHEEQQNDVEESIPELISSQKSNKSYAGSQGQDRDFRSESNGPTSATSEDTLLSQDEKQRKLEYLKSAAIRSEEVIDEGFGQLFSSKTNNALISEEGSDGKYEKYDKVAFQAPIDENCEKWILNCFQEKFETNKKKALGYKKDVIEYVEKYYDDIVEKLHNDAIKATQDVMRSDGPFDKLNLAKETVSRYRFQIDEALNGNEDNRDCLVDEFDEIFRDLREHESDARLKAQKITSYKDNEMKKEVHYKNDLTDSLISNIPNKNHFIEIRRCQKRLSTTSVSSSSRSTLPKKKIKVEDIKVEKADSVIVLSDDDDDLPTPPPVIKRISRDKVSPKIKRVVTMKNSQLSFNHGNIRRSLAENPASSTIPSRTSRMTNSMPSRKTSSASSRTKSPSNGPILVNPNRMDPPSSHRSDRGSVRTSNGHQRPIHSRPGPSNESYVSFGQRSTISGSSKWTHDLFFDSNDDARSIVPGTNNILLPKTSRFHSEQLYF